MTKPTVNFKQYQSQPEGSGKMLKLIILVVMLLLVGWLVSKGLNPDKEQHQPNYLEQQQIEGVELDTTNF